MLRRPAILIALARGLTSQFADPASSATADEALADWAPIEKVQYVYDGRNHCYYDYARRGFG
jgi:hypothetical protein